MAPLHDVVDLSRIASSYIFHPLAAAEVFLPHVRPISWINGSGAFTPDRDIPSLQGKVILITGGNTGLGEETVYQLARHQPAKIYLAARSSDKAQKAIERIQGHLHGGSKEGSNSIEHLQLDLSDLKSVQNAAKQILSAETRLDVLVLNAGIMATPPSRTPAGHEIQLGINHIGHYLLVRLLLPLMESTAQKIDTSDVRIVVVSSEAHRIAPSNLVGLVKDQDQLYSASPYRRYGVSKAANVAFAAEVARRHGARGITAVSLHPGVIQTDLYSPIMKSNAVVGHLLPFFAHMMFDQIPQGALTQLWCAVGAARGQLENGSYYTPVGRQRQSYLVTDEAIGKELWTWTEEQLKDYLT